MRVVVPRKESLTVGTGVLDTAKARWEFRTIFERLEVRLRVGIVINAPISPGLLHASAALRIRARSAALN